MILTARCSKNEHCNMQAFIMNKCSKSLHVCPLLLELLLTCHAICLCVVHTRGRSLRHCNHGTALRAMPLWLCRGCQALQHTCLSLLARHLRTISPSSVRFSSVLRGSEKYFAKRVWPCLFTSSRNLIVMWGVHRPQLVVSEESERAKDPTRGQAAWVQDRQFGAASGLGLDARRWRGCTASMYTAVSCVYGRCWPGKGALV